MFLALTPEATGFPISSDHLTGHLCLHVYRVGPIEWPDNDLHPGVSGVQYQRVAPEGVEQP